jgi:hypothetical protein
VHVVDATPASILPLLEQLLQSCVFANLSKIPPDPTSDNDEPQGYALIAVSASGQRTVVQANNLEDLLTVAAQGEKTKRCSRCGATKALTEFPRGGRDRRDGRASHCRQCDRKRMREKYNRAARGRLAGRTGRTFNPRLEPAVARTMA